MSGACMSLRFTLICPTKEDCGRVKTQMQNFPKQFEHLQLEFNPELNAGALIFKNWINKKKFNLILNF
jgi:hypothetical protein